MHKAGIPSESWYNTVHSSVPKLLYQLSVPSDETGIRAMVPSHLLNLYICYWLQ